MFLGILSCVSCSSPLGATSAFMNGMVDLRCVTLSVLATESFTLLYISGFQDLAKGSSSRGSFREINLCSFKYYLNDLFK